MTIDPWVLLEYLWMLLVPYILWLSSKKEDRIKSLEHRVNNMTANTQLLDQKIELTTERLEQQIAGVKEDTAQIKRMLEKRA